jgi:hypothetical protein
MACVGVIKKQATTKYINNALKFSIAYDNFLNDFVCWFRPTPSRRKMKLNFM